MLLLYCWFKDNHIKNAPSNKTQALTKSMNMDTAVIGTIKSTIFKRFSCSNKYFKKPM